jgi:hypothetical protein
MNHAENRVLDDKVIWSDEVTNLFVFGESDAEGLKSRIEKRCSIHEYRCTKSPRVSNWTDLVAVPHDLSPFYVRLETEAMDLVTVLYKLPILRFTNGSYSCISLQPLILLIGRDSVQCEAASLDTLGTELCLRANPVQDGKFLWEFPCLFRSECWSRMYEVTVK